MTRASSAAMVAALLSLAACTGGRGSDTPSGGAAPGQSGGAVRSAGGADSSGSVVGGTRGASTAPRDSARDSAAARPR